MTVLNRSTKGAMISSFRRASLIVFYQPKSENKMFQRISVNTNKIYQLDFLKVIVLSYSTKAAITGSFRRVPCSLSSIIKKSAKLKDLSKLL